MQLKKFITLIPISLMFLGPIASAQVSEDNNNLSSYETCILDKMAGVTSDIAAREIKLACRKVVANQQRATCNDALNEAEVKLIEGQPSVFGSSFYLDVYNPFADRVISGVVVNLTIRIQNEEYSRKINLRGSELVAPYEVKSFGGKFGLKASQEKEETEILYKIIGAFGCRAAS